MDVLGILTATAGAVSLGIRYSRERAVAVRPAGTLRTLDNLRMTATMGSEMPVMWAGPPSLLLVVAGAIVVLVACVYLVFFVSHNDGLDGVWNAIRVRNLLSLVNLRYSVPFVRAVIGVE